MIKNEKKVKGTLFGSLFGRESRMRVRIAQKMSNKENLFVKQCKNISNELLVFGGVMIFGPFTSSFAVATSVFNP